MTALARTVALLAEINPPVAAAVRAIGPNHDGWPLPGYLGWLPASARLDLCKAVCLAHQTTVFPDGTRFDHTPETLCADIRVPGVLPRGDIDHQAIEAGIRAWAAALGLNGRAADLLVTWVFSNLNRWDQHT